MIIQVDSRERKFDHVTNYFDSQDVQWFISKLVVGDYVNLKNPMVVIDRKQSLQEVASNVCQEHDRFVRELERANELGFKLIVLIEEPNVKDLVGVCSWYNWRRKTNPKAVNGKTLYKIMFTMSQKYGVEWQFTTKAKCGERIIELLGGEADAV